MVTIFNVLSSIKKHSSLLRPGLLLKCSMSEIEQLFTIIFFIYVIASETEDQEISDEVIIVPDSPTATKIPLP